MQSLYNDMEQDSINLKRVIASAEQQINMFDTLITLIHQPLPDSNDINKLYFFARFATRTVYFEPTDRTILQLNNSGNFRLISNISLADSILQYEGLEASYKGSTSISSTERYDLYPFISAIFDAIVFPTMIDSANHIHPPVGLHVIDISDKKLVNQFIYYVHQVRSTRVEENKSLHKLLKQTTVIRNLIKQNYKLQYMEVHHHPHVEKKNFKEYFLEFLMIFLAVTMGFFAENLREHFKNSDEINNDIESMVADLQSDVACSMQPWH